MAFKELFKKYKVYTIISIIAISLLVAGGVTAGLLIGKQGNEQLNVPALAADFTDTNGLEYTILSSTDLTVSVSGYSGSSTTVVIPETVVNGGTTYTVTTIAGGSSSTGAFANKTTLTSITIPSSITTMQGYAFYNCTALTEINFNATNMNDLVSNNYVFSSAGQDGTGITVNIGANVTRIPAYLFSTTYISYVVPHIVTVIFAEDSQCESIGEYAFSDCSSLTSITIPDSVTSIGNYAFYGCSSLTEVTIPDGVTSIGNGAFCVCSGLTNITIPESVTSIGNSAFPGCSSLTSITIPDSVTSIGDRVFSDCTGLTSVTIGRGLVSIGKDAFEDCTSLTNVYCEDINAWVSIDFKKDSYTDRCLSNPLYYAKNFYVNNILCTEVNIDTATEIKAYSLYNVTSLNKITIGNQVASIGERAFYNCSNLTTIVLGNGLTAIGYKAFYNTPWLTNIKNNNYELVQSSDGTKNYLIQVINTNITSYDLTGVEVIAGGVFSGCSSLTSITIPTNMTSIGSNTFFGCSSLTSITIPPSITSIGDSAFANCTGLTEINFNATNMSDLTSGSRVFYEAGASGSGIIVNIGANVTRIPAYLFCPRIYHSPTYFLNIKEVNFAPNSQCTSIGEMAFRWCRKLTSITIPENITYMGGFAFADCTGLTEINFNATNMSDCDRGNYGIFSCEEYVDANKITVNIGANVTRIPAYLFDGYNVAYMPIETVNFANNSQCTSIGESAFSYCEYLTDVTIPTSVKSIGSGAFTNCTSLTDIHYLGDINDWVGIDFVFYDANPLYDDNNKNLYLNGNLLTENIVIDKATEIKEFSLCGPLLKSVIIGDQVTSIGQGAFFNCSNLTSVTIGSGVNNIGFRAFASCSALTDVYFYNDISTDTSSIDDYAFGYNNSAVTYWVKDQTSLTNIQAIYNDVPTKFTSNNFKIIPNLTITTDASLGQIFINGELTTNYYEVITDSGITISNVIALPKANCAFLYWLVTTESGSKQVTDNPLSMTITETTTITAVFSNSLMEGVGVTAIGGGQVRMGGYEGDIDDTTQVTLNAICYSGYTFDGWYIMENGVETKLTEFGNSDAITINVSAYEGKLIIAKFVPVNNDDINDDVNN